MEKFDKNDLKKALIGLGVVAIYILASIFQSLPLALAGVDYEKLNITIKIIYSLMFELLLIIVIGSIYRKTLVKAFKDLKANHKQYFNDYFKFWILMIIIMMVSNGAISLITSQDVAGNEEAIRKMFDSYPIYTFISATIFAPIIEELVFRQAFRGMFKTGWLYILTSSLIFGSLHVLTGFTGIVDLLYLIPYCTPGIIFAYIMLKTDNIFVTMALHLFHNGIMMSLLILTTLLS